MSSVSGNEGVSGYNGPDFSPFNEGVPNDTKHKSMAVQILMDESNWANHSREMGKLAEDYIDVVGSSAIPPEATIKKVQDLWGKYLHERPPSDKPSLMIASETLKPQSSAPNRLYTDDLPKELKGKILSYVSPAEAGQLRSIPGFEKGSDLALIDFIKNPDIPYRDLGCKNGSDVLKLLKRLGPEKFKELSLSKLEGNHEEVQKLTDKLKDLYQTSGDRFEQREKYKKDRNEYIDSLRVEKTQLNHRKDKIIGRFAGYLIKLEFFASIFTFFSSSLKEEILLQKSLIESISRFENCIKDFSNIITKLDLKHGSDFSKIYTNEKELIGIFDKNLKRHKAFQDIKSLFGGPAAFKAIPVFDVPQDKDFNLDRLGAKDFKSSTMRGKLPGDNGTNFIAIKFRSGMEEEGESSVVVLSEYREGQWTYSGQRPSSSIEGEVKDIPIVFYKNFMFQESSEQILKNIIQRTDPL